MKDGVGRVGGFDDVILGHVFADNVGQPCFNVLKTFFFVTACGDK
jgi:hypothetical protein